MVFGSSAAPHTACSVPSPGLKARLRAPDGRLCRAYRAPASRRRTALAPATRLPTADEEPFVISSGEAQRRWSLRSRINARSFDWPAANRPAGGSCAWKRSISDGRKNNLIDGRRWCITGATALALHGRRTPWEQRRLAEGTTTAHVRERDGVDGASPNNTRAKTGATGGGRGRPEGVPLCYSRVACTTTTSHVLHVHTAFLYYI